MTRLALALLALIAAPSLAAPPPSAAPRGLMDAPRSRPLTGAELEARTNDIGGLLRCPVCQGLSVADSPSSMARNMKAEVREKLASGYDQEQILAYFERSYGEFVRLDPPMRGVNWLVWFGPLAVLVVGGGVVAFAVKRSSRKAGTDMPAVGTPDLPSRDTLPADPRLGAAVRRVRQLAYGWPDGVPPGPPARAS
ncbi:MAG: cytochrome c-type biogenesis protein CcmH [Myxococcales bacterium]